MSGFDDGSDDFLTGYKKPPVAHRFKKGQSGNPKGRPTKIERTVLPDQHDRDMLAFAHRLVRIKLNGKETEISTRQAVEMKLWTKALEGHGPSMREVLKRSDQAAVSFYETNKGNMELYKMLDEYVRSKLGRRPKGTADMLNALSRAIKKSLRE